jgi:hypothetical protein
MADPEKEPQEESGSPPEAPDEDEAAWTPFPSLRRLRGRGGLFGTSRRPDPEPADEDEPDQ